ncbi:pollen receptor-like kinase 3 [Telopea speciosissima]|uniref:pollen receptor-like kinase 3 n=1 Tax=Telopea speciosissima TaxID=54955 RepID=UPI001CC80ADF|nr:pollen receptor-like kinase 3 [Telopea speciosissima]
MAAVRLLQASSSSSSPSSFFNISIVFLFSIIFFITFPPMAFSIPDTDALLKLKESFINADTLDTWSSDSKPCADDTPWTGVLCFKGIIIGLRLGRMGLSGKIDVDALIEIPEIRSLSFISNNFTGSIPEFNRLGALKAIYLSGNKFSGEIPSHFFSTMGSLKKIWLNQNAFTGKIPTSLVSLTHPIEIHLEDNKFSGTIPSIEQTSLKSFNASNNNLKGEIPASLSKFNQSCFAGNDDLCGTQLGKDCEAKKPTAAAAQAQTSKTTETPTVHHSSSGNSVAVAVGTLAAVILLLVAAAIVVGRRREEEFDVLGRENLDAVELHVSSSASSRRKGMGSSRKGSGSSRRGTQHGKGGNGMGDLVLVNTEKGVFGLPDLMKAAAEVLGNGGLGSSYKAVMANGVAVVVKRMREINRVGRDAFDAEIKRLGRLRHPNILTPLAYHFRKDEKLLVYEYIPKGSLLYLLHGDRGPCHAELDWPARLKIVQGIARGMGYLHTQLGSLELPHGNLKSSNVLLGQDYQPLLADYGYCSLVNPTQAAQSMFAYKTPESLQYHLVSTKCDVYCLGIIILEIITGKFPSQYLNHGKGGTDVVQWVQTAMLEKREAELFDPEIAGSRRSLGEMERLLHIGAACTEQSPEQRPDMKEAIRRIEEIQVEGGQEGGGGDDRVIQMTPSLRDGYADQSSHAMNVREGYNDHSSRQSGQDFGDRTGRSNGDSFAFAIS